MVGIRGRGIRRSEYRINLTDPSGVLVQSVLTNEQQIWNTLFQEYQQGITMQQSAH